MHDIEMPAKIAKPARGQGAQAEHHKRPCGIGHQVFPAGNAEFGRDGAHGRGKYEQHQMIQCVRAVEHERGGAVHLLIVSCPGLLRLAQSRVPDHTGRLPDSRLVFRRTRP